MFSKDVNSLVTNLFVPKNTGNEPITINEQINYLSWKMINLF